MRCFLSYFILVLSVWSVVPSCKQGAKKDSGQTVAGNGDSVTPRAFHFAGEEKRTLKKKLKEISGLHYLDGDRFVAIQDEQGIIYTVDYQSGEIVSELPFGRPGDYEDITMDAGNYYVLESNGNIHKVPRQGSGQGTRVFSFPGGKNDFETIYLDATGENLVIICKSCSGDGGGTAFNAYAFNLATEKFTGAPVFTISSSGLAKTAAKKPDVFRPSAAAIHPVERKLYVLCSVGRVLLVCDLRGNIEDQYHLDPGSYRQPEGIAFKPNGDLFISNEAGNASANIIRIVYRRR